MSIGKNSIARAVNATAVQTKAVTNDSVITKFPLDSIGILSVAKMPDDIDSIKLSITKHGILCPLLTAITPKGDIWLLDGYRRYYAAKDLGYLQLAAVVINVENKSEANRIYTELAKCKFTPLKENIHEQKFSVLCVKDHDLPTYLL